MQFLTYSLKNFLPVCSRPQSGCFIKTWDYVHGVLQRRRFDYRPQVFSQARRSLFYLSVLSNSQTSMKQRE